MTSAQPLFSVVIPAFNRANLICKTLDSVVLQTYRPIEVIVVDDGSRDDTREVVSAWAMKVMNENALSVQYVWQENMGPASARNRGIAESSGQYIMFLDSDDLLYSNCLEQFSIIFHSQHADMVIAGCDEIQNGKIVWNNPGAFGKNQIEEVALGRLILMTIRIALSRQLVAKTGDWNTHMITGEDRDFFQRALFLAEQPVGVDASLSATVKGLWEHRSHGYDQGCRVQCEEALLNLLVHREGVRLHVINFVISRVARIGCQLNSMGYQELALRCASAVLKCNYPLSFKVRAQLLLCKSGRLGAWIYNSLFRLRVRT